MLIAGFSGPELAAAVALVVMAGLMRGFSGFGGSMIISPGLALIFATPQAVGVSLLLSLLVTVQLIPAALPLVRWREVAPIGIAALIMVPVGATILVSLDPIFMRRATGAFVLCFTVLLATDWRYKGKPNMATGIAAGAMSGFITGAAGVGGPAVIMYVLAGQGSAAEKRARLICIYSIFIISAVASFWAHDIYSPTTLGRAAVIAPFFLGAAWIGSRMFKYATDKIYNRVAQFALAGIAIAALLA